MMKLHRMRNCFSGFLVGTLFSMIMMMTVVAQPAASESDDNIDYSGPFVKLFGGLNQVLDSDFEGSGDSFFPSGKANLDLGSIIGMAGGYRFSRNLAAELDYAYRSNDISKIKGLGDKVIADGGDLASVAIMANGYYYITASESWSPYFGLGLGVLQEVDSDVQFVGASPQTDLEDQVFAWQAMVGAEVPINKNWRVYGEGRFMSTSGPELSNSSGGSYTVDYDNLSLMVGVGYQF